MSRRLPITATTRIGADNAARMVPETDAELAICLASWHWRIFSGQIYKILVKSANGDDDTAQLLKPFLPNQAQTDFLAEVHNRNVIAKARQLGFSTLICILWLDHALWNPDQACGIVAHTREDAESLFRDKVCIAYDNLPAFLRERFPPRVRNASTLIFAHNGSRIVVKTSLRSGTYQRVHVSELGKIAAKFPEKATEVMTGTLPTCPTDGVAVIESTAEGRSGPFYETVMTAKRLSETGRPLAQTQFKLHFFPWWREPGYRLDPTGIAVGRDDQEYFDRVEEVTGTFLTAAQRAWYISRRDSDLNGDQELMWREFPSTLDECFQQSTAGTYYAREISTARLQRRIATIPHADGVPVHTFWDIGAGDGTGVWCMQRIGLFYRLLRYIEGWDHGYSHYVKELRDTGWIFGRHFLPHDARHKRQMGNTIASPIEIMEGIAPDWTFEVVPKVSTIQDGIQVTRKIFPELMFDEIGCAEGIAHLEQYRKVWNSRHGTWGDEPEKKDGHSEAADALRQLAQAVHNGETFDAARSRQRRNRPGGMAA